MLRFIGLLVFEVDGNPYTPLMAFKGGFKTRKTFLWRQLYEKPFSCLKMAFTVQIPFLACFSL